ncbi:putative hydrolase [Helianthus debilis subsp. tardiflorus]
MLLSFGADCHLQDNQGKTALSWISKANAKQRAGRAGRCQPGICYRLYSKLRAASLMEFQVPEIKRTAIEELCLQVII